MDTGTDHISISIREFSTYNLSIGRVKEPEKGVAVVNADIREGRTMEKRRTLTYTLRWLVEVFFEDWKLYEGWAGMAKQPDEEGSFRGVILSLLLDHALFYSFIPSNEPAWKTEPPHGLWGV